MTDAPPTSFELNSAAEDLPTTTPTETVVHKEPPRYGFLNPAALRNTSMSPPGMIQYQPQSVAPGYGGGTPYMLNTAQGTHLPMPEVDSYEAWSIFNILCCCWIIGCIACHYSTETETLRARGDIVGAAAASKNARTMNIIATVGGLLVIIIVIILFVSGTFSHSS
jgi:Interferon-induced transmembrane protein